MSADTHSTKDRILQSAYGLFYREGFARVSVDAIAERAEVTKRTVYYHFQSKDDIAAATLERQHAYLFGQFQQWVGPDSSDPVRMIDRLFHELKRWADGAQWLGSGYSRMAAELADMPGHPARKAAQSHKAKVEAWLSDRLGDSDATHPERLARQIMTLIEGSMSLALIHGDTGYIETAGLAAKGLLTTAR